MNAFEGFVVYFLIWWVVIFCTLPFGAQGIENPKDGSMPGAPANPLLKKKIIFTTIISAVVWVVIYLIIRFGGISFRDMAQRMTM